MLDFSVLNIAVGIVLGILAGLGIGGGSLLILWLTMALGISQKDARSINLLFFLPAAGISILNHRRNGTLKAIYPALLTGPAAAAAASWVGLQLDTGILEKGFGLLLLFTGLRELFYKPKTN